MSNLPHFAPAPVCFLLLCVVNRFHLFYSSSSFQIQTRFVFSFGVVFMYACWTRFGFSFDVVFMHVSLSFFSVHGTFVVLFFNGSFAVVFSFINV